MRTQSKRVATGTTSLRTLESLFWLAAHHRLHGEWLDKVPQRAPYGELDSASSKWGWTDQDALDHLLAQGPWHGEQLSFETQLMIVPGYRVRMVHGLITNFHQPGSTLLCLAAIRWRKRLERDVRRCARQGYRFLSYGDSFSCAADPMPQHEQAPPKRQGLLKTDRGPWFLTQFAERRLSSMSAFFCMAFNTVNGKLAHARGDGALLFEVAVLAAGLGDLRGAITHTLLRRRWRLTCCQWGWTTPRLPLLLGPSGRFRGTVGNFTLRLRPVFTVSPTAPATSSKLAPTIFSAYNSPWPGSWHPCASPLPRPPRWARRPR